LAGTQFNGNTVTVQGWINCSIYRKLVQYAAPENIPNTKGNIVNILDQRGVRMQCYSSIISKPRHGTLSLSDDDVWYFYLEKSKEGCQILWPIVNYAWIKDSYLRIIPSLKM
jgi:hypothetical protein